jgi:hypothetical protein
VEDVHKGEVCPDHLFAHVVNCCHLWCPSGPRVSCCQVITLVRFKLARVSKIPSDMGNTCPLQSFSSNSTFIMLYLYHEMDVDRIGPAVFTPTGLLGHRYCWWWHLLVIQKSFALF